MLSDASEFIQALRNRKDLTIGIATGDWRETSIMKLQSAGMDFSGIEICSANDSFLRVEIIKLSLVKSGTVAPSKITYFGDASWDKNACRELKWNFVQEGERACITKIKDRAFWEL